SRTSSSGSAEAPARPSSSWIERGWTPDSERLNRTRFSQVLCQPSSSNGTKRTGPPKGSIKGGLPAVPAINRGGGLPGPTARTPPTPPRRSSRRRPAPMRCHGANRRRTPGPCRQPQRRAESLHPYFIRRLEPAMRAHGVAIRAEDQLDRVDQRAVQVEQESGKRHAGS